MPCTYILKLLRDGSYYIGSTRNLSERIARHNKGLVRSTRNKRPVQLVYSEEYALYKEAYVRERQIKSWKKRTLIEN